GIHREIIGLAVAAERHAGVDALIGGIEFAQAPQYFLNINRIGPAPNLQLSLIVVRHVFSLPMIRPSGHTGISAKKRAPHVDNNNALQKKPRHRRGPFCKKSRFWRAGGGKKTPQKKPRDSA